MSDLRVEAIATAVMTEPTYHPAGAFAGDRYLTGLVSNLGTIADRLGLSMSDLRYLHDDRVHGVAHHALACFDAVAGPQPLYVSRSGGEIDPFIAFLPTLVREHPWVTDALVLTHLEVLSGSAVFEFLSWAVTPVGATVLLVDEQVVATVSDPPPSLAAVALRVGTDGSGTRVSRWGAGPPPTPAGGVRLTGTRACDAWLEFATAVAHGGIGSGDVVILHMRDDVQEGWVLLEVEEPPVWRL